MSDTGNQGSEPYGLVANGTQLHQDATLSPLGLFVRKTWPFLKGSRAAAFSLGAALASAFGTSTHAADLVAQGPLKAPPSVATAYDWTGAYLGGHVAYSRGSANSTLFDPDASDASNSFGSLYGGVQAGYNYVLPSHV